MNIKRDLPNQAHATESVSQRTMRERLGAMLGRWHEALSPRVLRRTLVELQAIIDPSISNVEGGRRAAAVAGWYARATPEERRDCWRLMSEQFAPDVAAVGEALRAYEAALRTPDEAQAEVALHHAFVTPRTRLLQRFAAFDGGMRFLIEMRAELAPHLRTDKRLLALDNELAQLFDTWLDVGFLELRRISWDSPASLIEKLIRYEAVHHMRGWDDVKNRLDEDRRCYGFFHPNLPGEPLIFVQVALLTHMADSMVPLLDEQAKPADLAHANTAIFYSISSAQRGLRGVSFGDSLIKRVVEVLQQEFPGLQVFATLSPIPGLRKWVGEHLPALLGQMSARQCAELAIDCGWPVGNPIKESALLEALDIEPQRWPAHSARRRWLCWAAGQYLGRLDANNRPADPVARFHLSNGARVERLNWAADPSPKGLRQSWGLMVNYLYDLKRIDEHRSQLAAGRVPQSRAISGLEP